jgi:excisionase family DNA binding protein
MNKLITVQWAAGFLNVSQQRVYEMVRLGIIPAGVAVRLGRQIRISEEGLREWVAAGGQALPGGWRRGAE